MKINAQTRLLRIIAIILVMALINPINASAAITDPLNPLASQYLTGYNTYVRASGSGRITIYYDLIADYCVGELGVLTVTVYESNNKVDWSFAKTYRHTSYSGMLAYNKTVYSSHITHQGTAGKYYKAYVCFWAGDNSVGDTRYMWTNIVQAT